jgi:hypothetical protein
MVRKHKAPLDGKRIAWNGIQIILPSPGNRQLSTHFICSLKMTVVQPLKFAGPALDRIVMFEMPFIADCDKQLKITTAKSKINHCQNTGKKFWMALKLRDLAGIQLILQPKGSFFIVRPALQ